jgi:hypothetical protein
MSRRERPIVARYAKHERQAAYLDEAQSANAAGLNIKPFHGVTSQGYMHLISPMD